MVRLHAVTKVYVMGGQEVRALDGIDLEIFPGEFVAIIGPSGSGKSTLMHIVGCLDIPTGGSYELDGVEVANMDEYELAHIRNQKIGFVFQGFNLLSRTSALENVKLPMVYGRQANMDERAIAALDRVGLGDRLDHNPNELSGGQQQRVAIARAIATSPKLLLADEPTGNLATLQSEEIMQIFQSLNDEGSTVIMVTHEPDIAQHCKRIVSVRDGQVVDDHVITDRMMASNQIEKIKKQQAMDAASRAATLASQAPVAAGIPVDGGQAPA